MNLTAQPWEYSPRIQFSSRGTVFLGTLERNFHNGRVHIPVQHRHSLNKWWRSSSLSEGQKSSNPRSAFFQL